MSKLTNLIMFAVFVCSIGASAMVLSELGQTQQLVIAAMK